MKQKIKEINLSKILSQIAEFDDLLTERISDFHEIKGMMQARHAYVFYRKLLWEIRDTLRSTPK